MNKGFCPGLFMAIIRHASNNPEIRMDELAIAIMKEHPKLPFFHSLRKTSFQPITKTLVFQYCERMIVHINIENKGPLPNRRITATDHGKKYLEALNEIL